MAEKENMIDMISHCRLRNDYNYNFNSNSKSNSKSNSDSNNVNTNVNVRHIAKNVFYRGYCNSTTKFYWIIVVYIWISYIGSNIILLFISGYDDNNNNISILINHPNISNFVYSLIIVVTCLCIFITITLPYSWLELKIVAPNGLMSFLNDGLEDDYDEYFW